MKTIAIVDDDIYIGNMLEEVLQSENYHVLRAYSGTEALMVFERTKPDLILLDLMLPGLSGEAVLEKIRGVPVIIMSAKTDVQDKVDLLLSGAADYITKPFDTKELLARITVQLRNASCGMGTVLSVGDIELDTVAHEVRVRGNEVKLTKTEFAVLKLLMQNSGRVIAKSIILDRISYDTPDCMESSLKVHISNLRKKLRGDSDIDYIEAVWGIGFKMREL